MSTTESIETLVRIEVSHDRMSATLVLEPGADQAGALDQLVSARLAERTIQVSAPVDQAVRAALAAFADRPEQRLERVVAQGTPPVDAVASRLVFEPQYDPKHLAAPSDAPPGEKGTVDHYARRQYHPVTAGTRIGRIISATPGQDGWDITGKTVAAKQASAREVIIDESVIRGADGTLVAAADGIIDWREPRLRISQELVIPGFVDFSTGHVDFPGSILVERGVRDEFRLTAKRTITVNGLVEAAQLSAGLDLNLPGGMAAKERGRAEAHRDVHARYLDNVTVSAGRDLIVANEAINCHLRAARAFKSPESTVAGGLLECAREIEVGTLGAEAGTPTRVRMGVLPELDELLDRSHAIMPQLEARSAKAEAALAQLKSVTGKLSPKQAESLTELEFSVQQARSKRLPLVQAIDTLKTTVKARTLARLTVHKHLHTGVRIEIGQRAIEVTSALPGPVYVEASSDGEVIFRDSQRRAIELHSFTKITRLTPPAPAA